MSSTFDFYDSAALLERLSNGLKRRNQEVVFLVGSPLSAPTLSGAQGVPGVEGVIALIRREFEGDAPQLAAFNESLRGSNPYQSAFAFLQGRRGQFAANEIVRNAVVLARTSPPMPGIHGGNWTAIDEACRQMEFDNAGWFLSPGMEALGKLTTNYAGRFGRSVLTTNFDPLIEVSITRADGVYYKTILHADGYLGQTEAPGCHVIHLHGYWCGSDTLHTTRQLRQPRPRLRASLSSLLREKLVVVCAYGGWDDSFTEALMEVVHDDAAYPEVLWTFFSTSPDQNGSQTGRLAPGIDRGRVTLYAGIDCHVLFPKLYESWLSIEDPISPGKVGRSNAVHVSPEIAKQIATRTRKHTVLEGDDEDRPPLADIFVGRERELQTIRTSTARVVFITGLGGQGKSTVASQYFSDCQRDNPGFELFVWRDCKEEGERFENQLSSVIEKLTSGAVSGEDLAKQSAKAVVDVLTRLISERAVLFVFDNADHYVNLESRRLVGSADLMIEALLGRSSHSRVIFTCRPSISYDAPDILNCPLEGLDIEACKSLFASRGATATSEEINEAHNVTEGHAFWLDLLATQTAKRSPGKGLGALVNEIRSGSGPVIPAKTLNSIWTTLNDKDQTVLRAMAETLRPETERDIAAYLEGQLNYNKLTKALRSLRSQNLLVIKPRPDGHEFLELHPLVRQFVHTNFTKGERTSFMDAIIRVYLKFIRAHKAQLSERPTFSFLQYWTQSAELDISAGKLADAVSILAEASSAFEQSGYPREYVRVARLLFTDPSWPEALGNVRNLDVVLSSQARTLTYLGENGEVDALLGAYERSIPDRDARYILYCDMRCHAHWFRGDFEAAIKWGKRGQELKETSGVDTRYTAAHDLALAERDSGHPESALAVFLEGRSLPEVIDPDELDEKWKGHYYGNIGRCLHFMGQIDAALVCYQKSALLLEAGSGQGECRPPGLHTNLDCGAT